jgi:hypothetical protein
MVGVKELPGYIACEKKVIFANERHFKYQFFNSVPNPALVFVN